METLKLFTIADMARDFGSYFKQVRLLIDRDGIPTGKIGTSIVVDHEGYEHVRLAIEDHRRRPTLTKHHAIAS